MVAWWFFSPGLIVNWLNDLVARQSGQLSRPLYQEDLPCILFLWLSQILIYGMWANEQMEGVIQLKNYPREQCFLQARHYAMKREKPL